MCCVFTSLSLFPVPSPTPFSFSLFLSFSLFFSLYLSLRICISLLSPLSVSTLALSVRLHPYPYRGPWPLPLPWPFSSLVLLPSVCVVLSSHVVRRRCLSIGSQSSEEETKGVASSPKPARSRSMAIRRDDPDMLTPLLAAGTAGAASNSSSEGRVRRAGARRQMKPKPLGAIVAVEPGLWIGE